MNRKMRAKLSNQKAKLTKARREAEKLDRCEVCGGVQALVLIPVAPPDKRSMH